MKIRSETSTGSNDSDTLLEYPIDNDAMLFPDLWDSAMLPAEFVDMAWYYRQIQQQNKRAS